MKFSSSVGSTKSLKSSLDFNLSTHSHSFPGEISPFPPPNLELGSPPSLAYISLRDIIAPSSSTKGQSLTCSAIEISISNPLVKQVALYYLQRMPNKEGSSNNHFSVSQVWKRLSQELKHPVSACLGPKQSDIFEPKPKPKSKSTSRQKPSLYHSSSSSWERGGGHSMDDEDYTSTTLSLTIDTSPHCSIYENDPKCSEMVSQCSKIYNSVAVVKDSDDPYLDFRYSMLQMILQKEIYSEEDLQKLLNCFLQLNSPSHHDIIVRAFMEILNGVISTRPNSEKPYSSQGPH
ncbi:hypothetical protein F0562_001614 [Nyssa sinensis]|uniref:Transcription repressor n=1 Tax=Nyssa sinensis TaxID=561372 RepID=A0A5J5C7I8_9ASTE|nr:hypothetical protein F0562_001614 [Nyssa sinensis]